MGISSCGGSGKGLGASWPTAGSEDDTALALAAVPALRVLAAICASSDGALLLTVDFFSRPRRRHLASPS